ncbi:MAG: nitrous oxide-stimulated promoter family protein [Syntrophales bacterium]|nr:nitrous oxide-stimulated promoter family protein [Syntrophales bacterium]
MVKLEQEIETVRTMIGMYCRSRHGGGKALCEDCRSLCIYAESRIGKCSFGENKPVCSKCPIHCYKPQMRKQIGEVMRFSGPRMMFRHPLLAIRHLVTQRNSIKE